MSLAVALSQPTEYDRAVDYARKKPSITAKQMAKDLGIGAGVAKGFITKMVTAKIVAPPNDLGRALVIAAPRDYAAVESRSAEIVNLVVEVSDATGVNPVTLLNAARSGELQDAVDQLKAGREADAASISSDSVITGAAQTRLRTIVERIERLEEDRQVITADMKEVYAEAKGEGFDVKILRKVVSIRKKDKVKRDEEDALLDLYMSAIGM